MLKITRINHGLMSCALRSCPQYRVWLRDTFPHSPFKDQEQVGALLSQYIEQQEQEGLRRVLRSQPVGALPYDHEEPKGES